MRTMYFDTGVSQTAVYTHPPYHPRIFKGQVWRNGTKQIPYDVDAPENATEMFLCDTPDLPESKLPGVIVREVFNTTMSSKYVYLKI